jgi:DNA mismatch endonuclease, patch repair protein
MDSLSREKRSWNMSRIRSKDTKPEMIVRSLLHRMGCRFRIHMQKLPGKPDIVLPKYRTVIFVHGCYWHRHPGCKYAYTPKSRQEFWQQKFRENVKRHEVVAAQLDALGWRVIVVWECETMKPKVLSERLRALLCQPSDVVN